MIPTETYTTFQMTVEALPYWLVNVPKEQWPSECPDFLVNVNTKDRGILATPDAQYRRQSWPEVQHFISTVHGLLDNLYLLTHARDKPH